MKDVVDEEIGSIVKYNKRPSVNFYTARYEFQCGENCSKPCPDLMTPFKAGTNNKGVRVLMNKGNKIGEGGSSQVFKGFLHKRKIAAKYIDVSEQYRKTEQYLGDINSLLENLAVISSEASDQKEFNHKHILSVLEYWFQFKDLEKIYLVISTPLCKYTLRQCAKTEWNFQNDKIAVTFLFCLLMRK